MSIFPSLPDDAQLADVFRRFAKGVPALLAYHDDILRDRSPLTVATRELIAAYVSGLNACTYCHGSHVLAAEAFGIDPALLESLLHDVEAAAIDPALKPLLAFVAKLTREPAKIGARDAAAVYAAGWSEDALFAAISVCALFNFMNRIVEGAGVRIDPLAEGKAERAARVARLAQGEIASGAHAAERSYSLLAEKWGLESGPA
ncbi:MULTISPECIES: carboxymuconolactone decarboxylase family protein [Alphaproteobacteria]|jgi:uncharacterized peroxidase-related enzyme|uniref:carboxymuconolactone decarboxylase family protein n=1 Tax=Sphingopyxis TaxID=165697 RepID=UPI0007368933|nr:peroxidase-related enzyme [Sphingopyxis sp. H115]KTE01894.1 peroxidase [Sphingopyxis sp. H115]